MNNITLTLIIKGIQADLNLVLSEISLEDFRRLGRVQNIQCQKHVLTIYRSVRTTNKIPQDVRTILYLISL